MELNDITLSSPEEMQVVTIEDHPTHTDPFDIEVPSSWDGVQTVDYVKGLDLDLLIGIPQAKEKDLGVFNVEKLKEFENSVGAGFRDNKWYGHKSLEGGTDTIAYGHKLTSEEAETGIIKVGDREVDYLKGLSQEDAQAVLNKDAEFAKKIAVASLVKVGMEGDDGKVQALTSLIYNVGSGSWANSKAKQHLESGNVEDFMHEAFGEEKGWVHINGDKSRGLIRRRAAEAQLFGQTEVASAANIEEEDSGFVSMVKNVLDTINPIGSAQATEVAALPPSDTDIALQGANKVLDGLDNIRQAQSILGLSVDGINGPKTQAAVKAFQEERGLTVDGIVGPNTLKALSTVGTPKTTKRVTKAGDSSDIGDFLSLSLINSANAAEPDTLGQNEVPTTEDIIGTASAKNIVRTAQRTLGIHEDNPDDQAAVKGFLDSAIGKENVFGSDSAEVATTKAWCSAWLYHVLTSAGISRTKLANQMNSSDPYDFTRAHKYKEVGEPVWSKGDDKSSIKAGDIMVKMHTQEDIDNPSNGLKGRRVGFAGHVGIVTKVEGDEVHFLAGNSGGKQVKEASYSLADKDIVIRRPTGIENIPKEIIEEVTLEEEWGPFVAGFNRLFSADNFAEEADQMFKETGAPDLLNKVSKKVSDFFN